MIINNSVNSVWFRVSKFKTESNQIISVQFGFAYWGPFWSVISVKTELYSPLRVLHVYSYS